MAKLRYHLKRIFPEGDIMEIKIWEVPKSVDFPEGVKYSLVYVREGKRILGYDNERGKSHHKHYFDEENEIQYEDWGDLVGRFLEDVKKLRRETHEEYEG